MTRGPLPKDPRTRKRRNRASTAAVLPLEPEGVRAPKLPPRDDGQEWHERVRAWWRDAWRSPMAGEWLKSDIHGLYLLADLLQRFWTSERVSDRLKLAAEIRLQGQAFGLTPIDRRRLQWEIDRGEEAETRRAKRRARTMLDAAADGELPQPAEPRQILEG